MSNAHGNPLITRVLGISAIVLLAVLVVVIAGAAINQQRFLNNARLSAVAQTPANSQSTGWSEDPARNVVNKSNPASKRRRGSKRVVRAEGVDDDSLSVYPRIQPSVTHQYHARYKDPHTSGITTVPQRRFAATNVPYQQQQLQQHLHLHQQQQLHHQQQQQQQQLNQQQHHHHKQQPAAHHRRQMQPRLPPQRPHAAAHESQQQHQNHQALATTNLPDSQFDLNLEQQQQQPQPQPQPQPQQQQQPQPHQQQQVEPQNKLAPKRLLRGVGASVAPLKSKPAGGVPKPGPNTAQNSHRRNEVLIM